MENFLSKIPQFPGYVFNRVGTPVVGEYMLIAKGQLEIVSYPKLLDKNYVLYRKVPKVNTLTWSSLRDFAEMDLREGELLCTKENKESTINFWSTYVWNQQATRSELISMNKWGAILSVELKLEKDCE
jgi:hypothetical protein